jgi:hypothetical protein
MVSSNIPALLVTKGGALLSLYGIEPKALADGQERPAKDESTIAYNGQNIEPWGTDNLFPRTLVNKMSKCSLAMSALKFRIDAHYGKGILVYREEPADQGRIRKVPILDNKEWTAFKKKNKIQVLQAGLISDWEWFRNIFGVEIILNREGTKINRVYRRPAQQCRWRKRRGSKNIHEIVIRGDWMKSIASDNEEVVLPVLDIDDPLQDLKNQVAKTTKRKFFLPFRLEEFGNVYYDYPYWMSIIDSWIPIADNVAKAKNALLSNQVALKFHIKIPYSFWTSKYKDWPNMTPAQQMAKIQEFTNQIDEFLSDTENYGKSIVTHYGVDPINQQNTEEIKIEAIDNTKMKDGQNIIDGQAANAEILTALGVDPTLVGGILPGGKESGSGSNKREAMWIHLAKLGIDTAATTFWIPFVWEFNGWVKEGEEIHAGYRYIDSSQPLNENPTGSKEVL